MIELAPTLFLFNAFVLLLLSGLMFMIWREDEEATELRSWSSAFLMASGGAFCFALRNAIEPLAVIAGNALMLGASGLIWAGAVVFAKRTVRPLQPLAGGLLWLAGLWGAEIHVRIVAVSIVAAIYEIMTVYELYSYNRKQSERLLMSRVAAWVVAIHTAADLIVAISGQFVELDATRSYSASWVLKYRWLELSSYIAVLGFVLVALSKERIAARGENAAMVDPLTGLANRRGFDRAVERAMRTVTGKETTALLVFDLDNFKEINDRFGHPLGDRVLVAFGETAARNVRLGDMVARTGGEEFAALLCRVDRGTALAVAERIRSAFLDEASVLTDGQATVSVGVAVAENRAPDLAEMTLAADGALYQAKAAGRNRVVCAAS